MGVQGRPIMSSGRSNEIGGLPPSPPPHPVLGGPVKCVFSFPVVRNFTMLIPPNFIVDLHFFCYLFVS